MLLVRASGECARFVTREEAQEFARGGADNAAIPSLRALSLIAPRPVWELALRTDFCAHQAQIARLMKDVLFKKGKSASC